MNDKTKYMIVIVIVVVTLLICVSAEKYAELSNDFGGVDEVDHDFNFDLGTHSNVNTAFMDYDYNPYSNSGYVHPRAQKVQEYNEYYPAIHAPINAFPGTRLGVNTYVRANHPNNVILDSQYAKVMSNENTQSAPIPITRNASWV